MSKQPRIGYSGFGAYLPATVLTNDELERIVETSDGWIRRRTGICARRILDEDETILDMAVCASQRALADAGVTAEQLGDIRVGVNTWLRFPSLATQLQRELGADNASASDVSAGCAGFIYAVEEAHNKIFVERVRQDREMIALVVGVEALSHITDWTDRNTCVLLGDGAGAVVLREVSEGGILNIYTHAQGDYGHLLYSASVLENQREPSGKQPFKHEKQCDRPYLRMDGPKVYTIAIETMVHDINKVIERYNETAAQPIGISDIDYLYPHQANLRIIEKVAHRLNVPLEKVYTEGIVHYGNTSTASIPIGYWENRTQNNGHSAGRLEMDVAFGAGFASGAILRQT
ncbi:MAG: beta-ketoacyl-ACP synthase 3 [Planctomycetota bacterium]